MSFASHRRPRVPSSRYSSRTVFSTSDIDGIATYGRFEESRVAVALIRPPDGVIQYMNAAADRLLGRHGGVGRTVQEAVPELEGQGCLDLLARAFAGEGLAGVERPVLLDSPGEEQLRVRYLDLECRPVRDPDGEIGAVAVLAIDVTDRVLDRRQLDELSRQLDALQEEATLGEASDASLLSRALAYEDEIGRIAEQLVPALGDLCFVDLQAGDGRLRRVGVADADPRRAELVRQLERRPPPAYLAEHPIWTVLEGGEPVVVQEVPDSLREIVLALRERDGRSYVCLPLVSRGRTIGAVSLISGRPAAWGRGQLARIRSVMRAAVASAETLADRRDVGEPRAL